MNINPKLNREYDAIQVGEGFFQEPYTPTAGRITSAAHGGKKLQWAKMLLSADANVTWRDYAGNLVTAFALTKGLQDFLVSEIITVSTGSVLIVHNGLLWTADESVKDMTINFPTP